MKYQGRPSVLPVSQLNRALLRSLIIFAAAVTSLFPGVLDTDSLLIRLEDTMKSVDLRNLDSDTLIWLNQSNEFDTVSYSEPLLISRLESMSRKYRLTRGWGDRIFKDTDPQLSGFVNRHRELKVGENKRIRSIYVLHTDIGPAEPDTQTVGAVRAVVKGIHRLHVYTWEDVIRKHLLIHEGDRVNIPLFLENERLIRSLTFIDECKFLLSPVEDDPEQVDVVVVVKDRFAYNLSLNLDNRNHALLQFNLLNIYGSGNSGSQQFIFTGSGNRTRVYGMESRADFNNIGGMFINLSLLDREEDLLRNRQIMVNRPLSSDIFLYTGGLTLSTWAVRDSLEQLREFKYDDYDFWFGRSLNLGRERFRSSKIILSGRIFLRRAADGDSLWISSDETVHTRTDMLVNLTLNRRLYFYGNFIFDLGPTEDLPTGYMVSATLGQRSVENRMRFYYGLKLSAARFPGYRHYVYQSAEVSVWSDEGVLRDGMFNYDFFHFSPLRRLGDKFYRLVSRVNYTGGYERVDPSRLTLEDNILAGTLAGMDYYGLQRLRAGGEAIFYRRTRPSGFRSAFYVHGDVAMISGENDAILDQKPIWGLGAGYRIKHRRVAINALQLGAALLWREPGQVPTFMFSFSANQIVEFQDFILNKPDFMEFR